MSVFECETRLPQAQAHRKRNTRLNEVGSIMELPIHAPNIGKKKSVAFHLCVRFKNTLSKTLSKKVRRKPLYLILITLIGFFCFSLQYLWAPIEERVVEDTAIQFKYPSNNKTKALVVKKSEKQVGGTAYKRPFHTYSNNFNKSSNNKSKADTRVLIGILVRRNDFQARKRVRRSWLRALHAMEGLHITHYFIIGTSSNETEYGANNFILEQRENKDIYVAPCRESHLSLTCKVQSFMFEFAHTDDFDMMIKIDEDTYVQALGLSDMLLTIGNSPMTYIGVLKHRDSVQRFNTRYSEHIFPTPYWMYYMTGGFYALSSDLVQRIQCSYNMWGKKYWFTSEDTSTGFLISQVKGEVSLINLDPMVSSGKRPFWNPEVFIDPEVFLYYQSPPELTTLMMHYCEHGHCLPGIDTTSMRNNYVTLLGPEGYWKIFEHSSHWATMGIIIGYGDLNSRYIEFVRKACNVFHRRHHQLMVVGTHVPLELTESTNELLDWIAPKYFWCDDINNCGRKSRTPIFRTWWHFWASENNNATDMEPYNSKLFTMIHDVPKMLASPVAMMKHMGMTQIALMGYEPTLAEQEIPGISFYEVKHSSASCMKFPCLDLQSF